MNWPRSPWASSDPSIKRPEDWGRVPVYGQDYYEPALQVVKGLVDAADGQAPVLPTLYSPFQCAGQITGRDTLIAHLKQNPEAVKVGLAKATESLSSSGAGFVCGSSVYCCEVPSLQMARSATSILPTC